MRACVCVCVCVCACVRVLHDIVLEPSWWPRGAPGQGGRPWDRCGAGRTCHVRHRGGLTPVARHVSWRWSVAGPQVFPCPQRYAPAAIEPYDELSIALVLHHCPCPVPCSGLLVLNQNPATGEQEGKAPRAGALLQQPVDVLPHLPLTPSESPPPKLVHLQTARHCRHSIPQLSTRCQQRRGFVNVPERCV